MRKTDRVYLVTWSFPAGMWNVTRAYVDTEAQAIRCAKKQFGKNIEIHEVELEE